MRGIARNRHISIPGLTAPSQIPIIRRFVISLMKATLKKLMKINADRLVGELTVVSPTKIIREVWLSCVMTAADNQKNILIRAEIVARAAMSDSGII